jgi:hypothetical protein
MKADEVGGPCGMYGENQNACRVFMEKREGKRPLERPVYRWEDKVDLKELGWTGLIWLRIGTSSRPL